VSEGETVPEKDEVVKMIKFESIWKAIKKAASLTKLNTD
jgi:hypothetical protein